MGKCMGAGKSEELGPVIQSIIPSMYNSLAQCLTYNFTKISALLHKYVAVLHTAFTFLFLHFCARYSVHLECFFLFLCLLTPSIQTESLLPLCSHCCYVLFQDINHVVNYQPASMLPHPALASSGTTIVIFFVLVPYSSLAHRSL